MGGHAGTWTVYISIKEGPGVVERRVGSEASDGPPIVQSLSNQLKFGSRNKET